MTAPQQTFAGLRVGDRVVYRAGTQSEEGIITRFSGDGELAFVRYGSDETAKATRVEDLRLDQVPCSECGTPTFRIAYVGDRVVCPQCFGRLAVPA